MLTIILITCGGVMGALCRYHLILLLTKNFNHPPFYGTLLVNITGALLIGILIVLFQHNILYPWDKFVFTGFLGSYTTFSSYILDTCNLWRSQKYKLALSYFFSSLIFGFLFTLLGVIWGLKLFPN